jgi:sugar fermentation stimulation protein A
MRFSRPLVRATLLKRYKRFLADVTLESGETVTAHCANSGSMMGLARPGSEVWLQPAGNPNRKLAYDWEIERAPTPDGLAYVGINTARPNGLAEEAILAGLIPSLTGYAQLRREVRYGVNSRIDILLEKAGAPPCFVEVKNVHLLRKPGLAEFPDSVTSRGAKHLEELSAEVRAGNRALMLFVIQMRADRFAIASDLDPAYAKAFARALAAGVEAHAISCAVTPEAIVADTLVPIEDIAS